MRRFRLLLAAAWFVATACFVFWHFELSTDISAFLPTGDDRQRAEISKRVVRSELSRTLLVTVKGDHLADAVDASRRLEQALRADPLLARELLFIQGGPPEGVERAIWESYHPRRFAFFASDPAQALQQLSDEGLREAARELKRKLASPLSTLVSRVAAEDPFLAIVTLMDSLSAHGASLNVVDGRFVSESGHAVLLLGTRASAFDGESQRTILEHVRGAIAELERTTQSPLVVETAGAARFAVHAEQSIRRDVRRISSWSIGCMMLLCLGLFRSLRLMALALVPIACGMLAGLAGSLLLFQKVHGLTLAFGASLIGVCIDYVVHFYSHHLLSPEQRGPQHTLRRIWPGLLLGASSTMIGFAMLAGSTFPGLQEIAVFALLGIGFALLTTRWVVPLLVGRAGATPASLAALGSWLDRALRAMHRHRRGLWLVPAATLAVALVGLGSLRWQDDLSKLTPVPPELAEEDRRVRERVAQFESSRFVVAVGDDDEAALQVNEALLPALNAARAADELGAWQNAWPLLPSAETQREIAQLARAAELKQRWPAILEAEGFQADSFQPFFAALERPQPEPITYRRLSETPLAPLIRPFRVELDGQIGYLTFLRDVSAPQQLQRRIEAVDGAVFIDQAALTTRASRGYRQRIVRLMAVGLALIAMLFALRYRTLRATLSALVPSLLALAFTVGALSLCGVALNLLSLTALLMVLSIGVDYGVFLTEAKQRHGWGPNAPGAAGTSPTLVALVVAWCSTVFGFGLLALSEHPALNAIGLVAVVGVSASLLLAPVLLVLLRPNPR